MAGLVLENISKVFNDKTIAVSGVNIDIADGEFVAVVGPSGCGKSTILRIIAGLEEPSSGSVFIDGVNVDAVSPKDRDIAMVFQNYALYPHMSVFQNMAFGLKMRKFPKNEINKRVTAAAEILGLSKLLKNKTRSLSGGQRQRVAVGRAIVRQPKLFLFDEPLSNLDAKLRVSMRAELIKLHKRLSATMVYVTHDQVEAMSMGNRLIVINDGKVQQIGEPLAIYQNPVNKFVAGFIGTPPMNFITCRVSRTEGEIMLSTDDVKLTLPQLKKDTFNRVKDLNTVTFGIRPEDITETHYHMKPGAGQTITVTVDFMEPVGNEILATCSLAQSEIIVRLSPTTMIKPDETVTFHVNMERARLFHPETEEALL